MIPKGQMTGMLGVYLVAAELSQLGFIVSPTSRSARGADLLVTDQICQRAWSVQVKTNKNSASFWLLGKHSSRMKSASHAYVFVNLKGESRPEYLVVPSRHVAAKMKTTTRSTGSVWYAFRKADRLCKDEGWGLFGDPHLEDLDDDEKSQPDPSRVE